MALKGLFHTAELLAALAALDTNTTKSKITVLKNISCIKRVYLNLNWTM